MSKRENMNDDDDEGENVAGDDGDDEGGMSVESG